MFLNYYTIVIEPKMRDKRKIEWNEKLVTKISMDPYMEVHSYLWEGEGEMRPQFFQGKAPSASHKR